MNASEGSLRPSNPFATRFVRPGAVAYQFPTGTSAAELIARLAASGWNGQIIGPHGSGKSTLLASLAEPLAQAGRRCHSICLRDGQRRLPPDFLRGAQAAGANQLIIDGYEQLSRIRRWLLRASARRRGWGLLVTGHADLGFPTLLSAHSSVETAVQIAERLMAHSPCKLSRALIEAEFAAAGGNVRETLFRLFDRWEELSRQPS